jgi:surfactin synthase thioesterase subunit
LCAAWLTAQCGAQTVAAHVVRLLASRLADVPYCVIGHSVGTWVAFETLSLAREQGLPMPRKARARACSAACNIGVTPLRHIARCSSRASRRRTFPCRSGRGRCVACSHAMT